ncbi:uncharacterized protein BKA55DRAFT_572672 [Fusarium redolens]|uniref:Uncharacterized protein n=1 Tax=Fusarium redolens TaxID=48865 RepID=A0A9P9K830_FUSRE|nr:uncharacterized protein BKA55DRAFT_572672 [Fusarium redolens]KAH7247646.1 hypothetical protein BKA55DRAFT_572672 [Fusarium redolens]
MLGRQFETMTLRDASETNDVKLEDKELDQTHMAMLGFGITGYSENKSLLTQHKNEAGGRSSFDD